MWLDGEVVTGQIDKFCRAEIVQHGSVTLNCGVWFSTVSHIRIQSYNPLTANLLNFNPLEVVSR